MLHYHRAERSLQRERSSPVAQKIEKPEYLTVGEVLGRVLELEPKWQRFVAAFPSLVAGPLAPTIAVRFVFSLFFVTFFHHDVSIFWGGGPIGFVICYFGFANEWCFRFYTWFILVSVSSRVLFRFGPWGLFVSCLRPSGIDFIKICH